MLKIEYDDNQYQERYLTPIKKLEACIVEAILNCDTVSLKKIAVDIRRMEINIERFNNKRK